MRWLEREDTICCVIFIANHVYSNLSIDASIKEVIKHGVNKKEGSIKMKFSNIAALCDEYGLTVQTKMGRLVNYSVQNRIAFEDVLNTITNKIKN